MDWMAKYGVVTCVLAAGLMIILAKRVIENHFNGKFHTRTTRRLYRFDHSVLNIPLPPQSMWMNMGFWKNTEDFPAACRALLEEVLKSAQILQAEGPGGNKNVANTLSIIDLGFGCGDQCLYFKDVLDNQRQTKRDDDWTGLLKAYVGITLESPQFDFVQERLSPKRLNDNAAFEIYCADAGRPLTWTLELGNKLSLACQTNGERGNHENWLLGLDTLVHFQPSRWPVIEYANREYGTSLMAYDVCIAEDISVRQRILLRLISFFGRSPFANWVTIQEYRERLVTAGYARDRIEIHEISEHVFDPLAKFLRKREVELGQYGLSIGRFRYAARMFAWWGRTGVVKGCIIIARK